MVSLEFFSDLILPDGTQLLKEIFPGGKGGLCVGLTTLTPSSTDCLKIWKPHPHRTLTARPGMYRDCCNFAMTVDICICDQGNFILPTNSSPTRKKFRHSESGGRSFLWNVGQPSYPTWCSNRKTDISVTLTVKVEVLYEGRHSVLLSICNYSQV
jgi:hypothetical protein